MAKVSIRALRRELRAARIEIADALLLERERAIEASGLRRQIEGRDVHIKEMCGRIDKLSMDLGKEQQFSELVTGCLHGVLAMTMKGQGMPSTGMMVGVNHERR